MDGQPTRGGFAASTRATWRDFLEYLRKPRLPDRARGVSGDGWRTIARLLPLDLAAMALLIGGFELLSALGVKLPDHMLADLELGPVLIVALVLGAPLAEETIFRGWLSGRPGHVLALSALLATVFGAIFASHALGSATPTGALAILGVIVAGCIAIALVLWFNRRKPAWAWFQRHFAWFYYASALIFASIHLANFEGGSWAILLPLTLPQFVLGLMLGFLRVRHGLWASMTLHALHNALFVGLVVAAGA